MYLKANVGGFMFYVRGPLRVSVRASLNELIIFYSPCFHQKAIICLNSLNIRSEIWRRYLGPLIVNILANVVFYDQV